jgi:hypothetical protein
MKRPPRKRKDLSSSTPRIDLAATFMVPPLSGTLSTQIPQIPAHLTAPTPVKLVVGDPAMLQVDMRAFVAGAVEFITEHPVLSMTIAAGVILAIWAYNQPPAQPAWA